MFPFHDNYMKSDIKTNQLPAYVLIWGLWYQMRVDKERISKNNHELLTTRKLNFSVYWHNNYA